MVILDGLEDCVNFLKSGDYEVRTSSSNGEKYIFPVTDGKKLDSQSIPLREKKEISSIDDWVGICIPDVFKTGHHRWEITDSFILNMKRSILPKHKESYVGRFSYEPESGEFLPSLIDVSHATTINRFGNHVYNLYVRGIYSKEKGIVLIKPYFNPLDEEWRFDPYGFYDPEVDEEKTRKTLEMLAMNGLPSKIGIITQAPNSVVKEFFWFV